MDALLLHAPPPEQAMSNKSKKAGRRSYLDTIVASIVQGAEGRAPIDVIKAMVVQAVQNDARVGGRDGRTVAEIIDLCAEKLEESGHPATREEIIRILANPKTTADAARIYKEKADTRNKPGKRV